MEIILKELNDMRHKAMLFQLISIGLTVLAFLCILTGAIQVFIILIPLVLISYFGFTKSSIKKYKESYKAKIVQAVLSKHFNQIHYDQEGISQSEFDQCELFGTYSNFYSSDLIRGTYQNHGFTFSDVLVQQVHSNGKSTYTETIFKGSFFIIDINRDTATLTKIYERKFFGGEERRGLFSSLTKCEKLKTESNLFNDEFAVYTENGVDAFYLLTPKVMETLLNIKLRLDFSCAFLDNKLYMAIENEEDHFEPSLFSNLDESVFDKEEVACEQLIELLKQIIKIEWN